MGYLKGLQEYLDEAYEYSIFDREFDSKVLMRIHIHGLRVINARVLENLKYDVKVAIEDQGEEVLPKVQVKFLYRAELSEKVEPVVKWDNKVKALDLSPIVSPHKRYFVKNKTLFPLMEERQVVFFTLLEGEIVKGIITDFSRYEITVHLKGGVPITVLRHSVYDLRNKKGRCFLKSFQESHRD